MINIELILKILSGIVSGVIAIALYTLFAGYLSDHHGIRLRPRISLFLIALPGLFLYQFSTSTLENLFDLQFTNDFETIPSDFPPVVNGTICQHFSSLSNSQIGDYVCIYGSASQAYNGKYDEIILADNNSIAKFRSDLYIYDMNTNARECVYAYGYFKSLLPAVEIIDNQKIYEQVLGDYNQSFTSCTKPTTRVPIIKPNPTNSIPTPIKTPTKAPTRTPILAPTMHGIECKHFTQITDADIYQNICVYGRADRDYHPTFSWIVLTKGYRSIQLTSNVWVYDEYIPAGTCVVAYGRPQNNDNYITFIIHSETDNSKIYDEPNAGDLCEK